MNYPNSTQLSEIITSLANSGESSSTATEKAAQFCLAVMNCTALVEVIKTTLLQSAGIATALGVDEVEFQFRTAICFIMIGVDLGVSFAAAQQLSEVIGETK